MSLYERFDLWAEPWFLGVVCGAALALFCMWMVDRADEKYRERRRK